MIYNTDVRLCNAEEKKVHFWMAMRFGSDYNISTAAGWIATEICADEDPRGWILLALVISWLLI